MAMQDNLAALAAVLARHPEGLTAAQAATLIGVPMRTARRYLGGLYGEGKVRRTPSYTEKAGQQVFAWVYRVAA